MSENLWFASITSEGEPSTQRNQAAAAIHAVWPQFQFALDSIEPEEPESGLWLIPIPVQAWSQTSTTWVGTDEDGVNHEIEVPQP